ncbi:NADP-binding protein [Dacryopinax primogenitus]|uniref:NADP-binding protein n=1 Tax=Dacryopinax primogenitus (strain DJM 731) TaxID=1858805 RepID=M5FR50_DACPD|nr:NADP-binding protein [Dacryopinax primogenitus]EJT98088.1 NADP-binding protein [Dacryopinax primogenitus]
MPTRPLVLVTGATGFIGTAIVLHLIAQGYRVLATTRSFTKVNSFLSRHPRLADSVAWTIIPDMTSPSAFDSAVTGVDYIIHAAAPVNRSWKPFEASAIDVATKGVTNLLEAAAKASSVRRVVVTSSFAAVFDHRKGARVGYTYTDKDWSPLTTEDAKEGGDPAYVVSKKLAEQAAWDFIAHHKPHFTLTTICPPLVFGPPLQPVDSMSELNTSADEVWKLMNGSCGVLPPTLIPTWVDVRDVARRHVAALSHPHAPNQLYLTVAGLLSNAQIAHILGQAFPDLLANAQIPASNNEPPPPMSAVDSRRAIEDFGGWVAMEESVTDTAKALLELAKRVRP